jgi:hypothetical protein
LFVTIDSANIFGTYESYKTGTKNLINWLVQNARACGYTLPEGISTNSKKSNSNGNKKKKTVQATFTLAVREYPALARAIETSTA